MIVVSYYTAEIAICIRESAQILATNGLFIDEMA